MYMRLENNSTFCHINQWINAYTYSTYGETNNIDFYYIFSILPTTSMELKFLDAAHLLITISEDFLGRKVLLISYLSEGNACMGQ